VQLVDKDPERSRNPNEVCACIGARIGETQPRPGLRALESGRCRGATTSRTGG
jgi:hypothetical protein